MSYVAIPSNLKNVDSVSLELMSAEEMLNMSYGEVLTAETINYRTGIPQTNGLFCQAIFGPVRDWECQCGKYKRYRYAGVICDKCGVMVTHSSVRRERMGHITLAVPCVHPWFLRIIPSRVALILDMKAAEISRVAYFSAYVITEIHEEIRAEYIFKLDNEAQLRIKNNKAEYDIKFDNLSRQYQIDKSAGNHDPETLKVKYETDKEILKTQQAETVSRIETIAEVAKKEIMLLEYKSVITEVVYQELSQKFGPVFKAGIGAEAIEQLLKNIDLDKEIEALKEKAATARGATKQKLAKRIKLIKAFQRNNTRPDWMILRRVMVLPPELRPMLQLDGGRFAASDLNELYRRLINRNNRLRKLIQIGAPEIILRNEKRMLQEAVEALIDNSARGGRQVMASTGVKRALKSLTDVLKGKGGRFRQNLLGKRVDYSGRSVIIVGPSLKLNQCGLPKEMALELFKPFMIGKIIQKSELGLMVDEGSAYNVHSARRLIESRKPLVYDILDEVIKDKHVLLNRAPTLHRLGFLAFQPVLVEGKAIRLHPLVCPAFNADFDGDQMAVHLPITVKGQEEARDLMVATKNLLRPANGEIIMQGHQDILLGIYYLTSVGKEVENPRRYNSTSMVLRALADREIEISELIRVKLPAEKGGETVNTTAGRILFNRCFPDSFNFINKELNKKNYGALVSESYHFLGQDVMAKVLDTIKDTAFKYVTEAGITLSYKDFTNPDGKHELLSETRGKVKQLGEYFDLGLMTDKERHKQVVNQWRVTSDDISKLTEQAMDKRGNVGMIINSGARGNVTALNQIVGMKGLLMTASGDIVELPVQSSYLEGLTGLEYFISMRGQRKALADIALKTADAGYLTRKMVDVSQNLVAMAEDCFTKQGVCITLMGSKLMSKSIWDRAYGRFLLKDLKDVSGKVLANAGDFLDYKLVSELREKEVEEIWVRSSVKCQLPRGVCRKCYGVDFSSHQPVKLGSAVGIIAAQSLGEPSTQLSLRSKHFGGVAMKADINSGLARVEEILEARVPKYIAPMSILDGTVEKVEGSLDEGFKITIVSHPSTFKLEKDSTDMLLLGNGSTVSATDDLFVHSTGEVMKAGHNGVVETEGNTIVISQLGPELQEYTTVPGLVSLVKTGDKVFRGQALAEGPLNLQDIMDSIGVDAVYQYIVTQLNEIYVSNGITVNEKHIELIVRQMCNRVQVIDQGEGELSLGDLVSLSLVQSMNKKLEAEGKKIIIYKRIVIGISRASLATESWLSAASFQETAKVLVEAVISGRKDQLLGLKENVILGQLIPAGTGFDGVKAITTEIQEEFEEEISPDLEESMVEV